MCKFNLSPLSNPPGIVKLSKESQQTIIANKILVNPICAAVFITKESNFPPRQEPRPFSHLLFKHTFLITNSQLSKPESLPHINSSPSKILHFHSIVPLFKLLQPWH